MNPLISLAALACICLISAGCENPVETGAEAAPSQFGPASAPPAAQSMPQQMPSNAALPPGAMRVKRAEIIDPHGFGKPLVAATVFIPLNWNAQGGVIWPQTACGGGYNFNWSAAAPDGSTGVAIIPSSNWTFSNMPMGNNPCPVVQVTSARDYLQWRVQSVRQGARVLDYRSRPDLTKGMEGFNRRDPMPMGEMRTWVDAGELLIGYNANGREMRETIAAVVVITTSRMQDAIGGTAEFLSGMALPGYVYYAPDGQLDFKKAEAIRTSIRQGAEWSQRIAEHNRKMAQINRKGAMDRARITAQANSEINDIIHQGWKDRNAIQDRGQREATEVIRGVETYADSESPTGTVELSNTYENAWRMPDGTYVLTDDAFFEPADGVKLSPAP